MANLKHNYVMYYVYYYNPLHVSSNSVLIIRRSNCITTASDIVLSVSDRPVCTCKPDGYLHRILYQMLSVLIQFDLLMMSTELLKTCRGL